MLVYNAFLNSNTENKYAACQLINYLKDIVDDKFTEEFNINNGQDIERFVKCISDTKVDSHDKLKMKVNLAKHLEYSKIDLSFSRKFKLEDIEDDVLIKLFDNIENRL